MKWFYILMVMMSEMIDELMIIVLNTDERKSSPDLFHVRGFGTPCVLMGKEVVNVSQIDMLPDSLPI
jgi:hypothetical protein